MEAGVGALGVPAAEFKGIEVISHFYPDFLISDYIE
tara:strand:+ start:157 stop:264 length:108 start_codon:yes stop_codon:yes gene_type:complete